MDSVEHCGVRVSLCERVYAPSDDTFLLCDALKTVSGKRCLELGCGTGLAAVMLAKNRNEVWASDINPHAVECCRRNALENGVKVRAVQADLFPGRCGRFDVVAFNPPYLPTGDGDRTDEWTDAATDGGSDGLAVTRRFLAGLPKHLAADGEAYLVVSYPYRYRL